MARTYAKITIDGTDYDGADDRILNVLVTKIVDVAASTFEIRFLNYNGQFKDTFTIGDDVTIYHDSSATPTQKIFRGIIEEILFQSEPNNMEFCILKGRDYSARLFDFTVLRTFNNAEASVIITTIMADIPEITLTNVQVTGKTFDIIQFKHKAISDAIKEIADRIGYRFFVDDDKDLHFEPKATISTGITLDSTNCMFGEFKTNSNEMFNKILVYGGRYLSGFQETFTANGGSEYSLLYRPHNTTVFLNDIIKIGAVINQTSSAPSGAQYYIDFDGQKVIWISGTGNYPASGTGSIKVDYHRSLPIVKQTQNLESQDLYGVRTKVIVDTDIVDPKHAKEIAQLEIIKYGRPVFGGRAQIQNSSITKIDAGKTITVNLPNAGLDSEEFEVIEVNYNINKETLLNNSVINVMFSERVKDVTDIIKKLADDIANLKAQDIEEADTLTQILQSAGNVNVKTNWYVKKIGVGSALIFDHDANGVLDVVGAGVQPLLDDFREAAVIQYSGGEW